jgi:non-ribosomal peptide synthetase component F
VAFARRTFTLDDAAAAALRQHASRLGATPTGLIFEAFCHSLHALGAGQRFAVTVPRSYRPDYAPPGVEVLGNFTQLASCDIDYAAAPPGSAQAVAAAQQQLWATLDRDTDATANLAATRAAGVSGYPVVFTSTLGLTRAAPAGLSSVRTLTQTPGVLLDCQIEDDESGIRLSWDVAVDVVAAEPIATGFARFQREVRRYAGLKDTPEPPAPGGHGDWASAVIASALQHCDPGRIRAQYAPLVRRWQSVPAPAGTAVDDAGRAARRLADIVTGATSPRVLIGDPQLAPEAMLAAEPRLQPGLDDLAEKIFAHSRALRRRLRIMELGSRTGLVTARLTGILGAVIDEYLCVEPNPVLAEIAAGRDTAVPVRHLEAPGQAGAAGVDVVICCGSLHQLPGAGTAVEAITVYEGGWLWLAENSEITPATLTSAAVLDPGLLAPESPSLRSPDQWWRFLAEHGWRPSQMNHDGPGLTIIADRAETATAPAATAASEQVRRRPETPAPAPRVADESVVAAIAAIWQRHLGIATPSADDDFFLLGADSLIATRVYADMSAAGLTRLAFVDLFNYPVLGELAAHAGPPAAPHPAPEHRSATPRRPESNHYRLTVVQQAYWAGRAGGFLLSGVAAHCYFEFDAARLDPARLEHAARRLMQRHPGLRTTISAEATETATAIVHPDPIEPVVHRCDDPRAALRNQVIDLTARPGIEIGVRAGDDGSAVIGISMDNTMLDGASMMTALAELDYLYRGGDVGELPALPTSFADYVHDRPELSPDADESRLPLLAAARDYWRARLATLPPAPPLAATSTLLDTGTPEFERVQASIDAADWAQITRSCRREKVTVASLLLAGYARVLAAWSGTPHFCINVTLFDRDPSVPGVERIIGDFTSLVLLECRVQAGASIWEQARETQHQLMTDLPHRGADAVWLQRELLRHHGRPAAAIYPVVFTSGLGLVDSPAAAAPAALGELVFGASQTPQTVLDFQVWESAGALRLSWDFVTQDVPAATARANLDALVDTLIGATGTAPSPAGDDAVLDRVL